VCVCVCVCVFVLCRLFVYLFVARGCLLFVVVT
jgi:hypothetical protein